MLLRCRWLIVQSCVLAGAILVTAVSSLVVGSGWGAIVFAAMVAMVAMVPPLWFEFWMGRSVATPTAAVAWRLGLLLPAVLLSASQAEPTRKCFQYTLLACYFIALPLESWLLVRQSRQ